MNKPTTIGYAKWLGEWIIALTVFIGGIAGAFLILIFGAGLLFATEETITSLANNFWVIGPIACTLILFIIFTWDKYCELCRRGEE